MFKSKYMYIVLVAAFLCCVVVAQHGHSHGGHGHGHGHHGHSHGAHDHGHVHSHGGGHDHAQHDEPPSFKYSRAANEKAQEQHGHVHSHGDPHHHGHSHEEKREPAKEKAVPKEELERLLKAMPSLRKGGRSKLEVSLHACLATVLISVAPFVVLFFIPLNSNSAENQPLLNVLLAFASGSLLGDAFLHLIPHALNPHDHNDEEGDHGHTHSHDAPHDHSSQITVGLCVLAGILTFLLVEKLVRNLKGGSHSHSHQHSHSATKKPQEEKPKSNKKKAKLSDDEEEEEEKKEVEEDEKKKKAVTASKKKHDENGKEEKSEKKKEEEKDEHKHENEAPIEEIQIAGYLNLAADFAHNFTDGLAIGASFLAGQNIGIVTTLTILFHEVPHEIGDFAILIQSGCNKTKAIMLQLVTALGALSGTILSLVLEDAISSFATSCILPFTAGGFIYIATVSIMPDLKDSLGFRQTFKEIIALVAGVSMMIVIAYLE